MKPCLSIRTDINVTGLSQFPQFSVWRKNARGAQPRKAPKIAYLSAILIAATSAVHATSAVVFITKDNIILAADGFANSDEGQEPACETLKSGDFFGTIAGIIPAKFKPLDIANATLVQGFGNHLERAEQFSADVAKSLSRTHRRKDGDGPIVLEIVLTWFEGNIARGRYLVFVNSSDGVLAQKPEDLVPGEVGLMRPTGYSAVMNAYMDERGYPWPPTPAFAEALIQAEINGNGGRSGGAVSVIDVSAPDRGTYWKQGNCR